MKGNTLNTPSASASPADARPVDSSGTIFEVDHQEVEALHSEIEQLKMELSKAPKNVLHVMPTRNLGVRCGLSF